MTVWQTKKVAAAFPGNAPIPPYKPIKSGFMCADRIFKFGERFRGRLDSILLDGAMDYVRYGEEGLALEILCDHLCEYDVSITDEEYGEAIELIVDIGFDLDEMPFRHLKGLASKFYR